jgi:hypothetical protein
MSNSTRQVLPEAKDQDEARSLACVHGEGRKGSDIKVPCRLIFAMGLIVYCLTFDSALLGGPLQPLSREQLAGELKRQFQLIRSAQAEFAVTAMPTSNQTYAKVRELRQKQGDAHRYFVTEEMARDRSTLVKWWRKDARERQESSPIASPVVIPDGPRQTIAFDGNVVRKLTLKPSGPLGTVTTVQGGHWYDTNRLQPFSFVFEYQGTPYWQIIAKGKDYACDVLRRGGEDVYSVSIKHPQFWDENRTNFVLVFNQSLQLIERQLMATDAEDHTRIRLCELDEFSDYQAHKDESGETIWFPARALYSYSAGALPDGQQVFSALERIEVKRIMFNIDISDDLFTLSFPPGARVFDGISGLGWLGKGELPSAARAPTGWSVMVLATIAMLALVTIPAFYWWRRTRAVG